MKKILMLAAGFMMLGSFIVFADTTDSSVSSDLEKTEAKLVTINSGSTRANQIERRVTALERELRDQSDAIRDLERDLSDLRRRRN